MNKNYTIIRNGKIRFTVNGSLSKINKMIKSGDTYIEGNFPRSEYEIVDGLPVELESSQMDLLSVSKLNKISVSNLNRNALKLVEIDMTMKEAKEQIDMAAGDARQRYKTNGSFIDDEYKFLVLDVERFEKNGDIGRFLQVYMEEEELPVEDAVHNIVEAMKDYENIVYRTSVIRRKAAKAIEKSTKNHHRIALRFIKRLDGL